MAGVRDGNLRSGDLHEELGILLLKTIALVAPVPRQEDVGLDAFATLIRPEGSRRLIPDLSFFVQLKAASVSSVRYTSPAEMAWLEALDVPFFIGRVDLTESKMELFTTLRLQQVLLEQSYEGIELLLDPMDESFARRAVRRAWIGPPIFSWAIAETNARDLLVRAHSAIRPHIETLQTNRTLRKANKMKWLRWETGTPPVECGEMTFINSTSDISATLQAMAPYARRLMTELQSRQRYSDLPIVVGLFDLMRRWGVDPDPGDSAFTIAAMSAGGPELSTEQAILIRHAVPSNGLDLRDLEVSDENLDLIPEGVTGLVLIDSPITDEGLKRLIRLQSLVRLNLAGTQISDLGLAELRNLPRLQWLCVHRTLVTAVAIEQLENHCPALEVWLDREP